MAQMQDHGKELGRAGEVAGCSTLPLPASGRDTPHFRQWRKCRQPSLARGCRKGYRWFGSPVAYSKARTIAGIRYKQTEPQCVLRTSCGSADI